MEIEHWTLPILGGMILEMRVRMEKMTAHTARVQRALAAHDADSRRHVKIAAAGIVFLAVLALPACNLRRAADGGAIAADAKRGAAAGFVIGGPEGAAIGSAISVAIGLVVRAFEKKRVEHKARARALGEVRA